jgi:hypothetical protein
MRFVEDYGVHMWLIRKFGGRDTPLQSRQTCVRVYAVAETSLIKIGLGIVIVRRRRSPM